MTANQDTGKKNYEFDLKFLKRYKKIYLYKQKFYDLRQAGKITDEVIEDFRKLLLDESNDKNHNITIPIITDEKRNEWFEITDSQSFKAEASQIIRKLPIGKARNYQNLLTEFEDKFSSCENDTRCKESLYYQKVTKSILKERDKALEPDKYSSLINFIKLNYPAAGATNSAIALKELRDFIKNDLHKLCVYTEDVKEENKDSKFPKYAEFVFGNSEEFKRRILNVFFSVMANVDPSDEVPFVRRNGQAIDYTIFRILAWLRNLHFKYDDFTHFLASIDANDLPNRMTIDYGLTGVIKLFQKYVLDPIWIDNLIKTHRIVKGLWQNGSKFLNSYTLHNEDHAVKLINLSVDIQKRIDYIKLKRADFYILFLACYLHDLSMVIHPDLQEFSHVDYKNLDCMASLLADFKDVAKDFNNFNSINIPNKEKDNQGIEDLWKKFGVYMLSIFEKVYTYFENKVRENHPNDSAQFLINKSSSLFSYLDPSTISDVALAGKNHGVSSADIFDIVSTAHEDTISQKYISMVLRLADLLDVSNDRINYHLLNENVKHLPDESKFHWISHLITDDIQLIPTYFTYSKESKKDGNTYKRYYIKEILRFYLILNVKSVNPIDISPCNHCCDWYPTKYSLEIKPAEDETLEGDVKVKKEYDAYKDYDGITIKFGKDRCSHKSCPMICRWITYKHRWLFEELKTLENYLRTANHYPFRTEIEVNILFKDLFNIEPHLYDSVIEHLKNQN